MDSHKVKKKERKKCEEKRTWYKKLDTQQFKVTAVGFCL
jgi:hypothetical protein